MTIEATRPLQDSDLDDRRASAPPRPPRLRRRARPPRPPRPPRRPPPSARVYAPLTPTAALAQSVIRIAGVLLLVFVANVTVLSQVQHAVSQQQLHDRFQDELDRGVAPVSEGTVDDVLLSDGDPVAIIDIPAIGVREIVVEGTSGGELMRGPGHRRDTVLPGQRGVSVLQGRAAAYGGPFARIQELGPGDDITLITGQGRQRFEVMGVRYAGDATPPSLTPGSARLMLQSARGPMFAPSGIVYVDAELTGTAQAAGLRQTTYRSLPPEDLPMATDSRTLWALVFALQLLIVVAIGTAWSRARIGPRKTWVVAVPVLVLASLFVADQVTRLLPNLL